MRVTTNSYSNTYINAHNKLQNKLLQSQKKILTQRKFTRASEDTFSASKAMTVRKNISDLDMYTENCKMAKDLFAAAESSLYDIANNTYLNISQKLLSVQDTFNQDDLNIVAKEIRSLADHCIQDLNSSFSERQMFGGSSNNKTPFTKYSYVEVLDADGNELMKLGTKGTEIQKSSTEIICYNDIPVNLSGENLLKTISSGKVVYYDGTGNKISENVINVEAENNSTGTYKDFPGNRHSYVDIGIGIDYNKLDSTSMDISMNCVQITGCGTDKDGASQNFVQLVYEIADSLEKGDRDFVNSSIDKLENARTKILDFIVDLGVKQTSLESHIARNESSRILLMDKQNSLEGCDIEREITNFKTLEAAYNASLTMGAKVLPKSIFDFI